MIIKSAELETVCGITSVLPKNLLPEIAFAGRSNVGKSSLINKLLNRKALARTSSQPGKTQTINFYNINKSLYFVDLPGYGYAKVSEETKQKWGRMVENYLKTSKQLRHIFLLIDIRHALSESDRIMYQWIEAQGFEPAVILTKADKIKRSQLTKQQKLITSEIGLSEGTKVVVFSSVTGQGVDELWNYINDQSGKEQKC